MRRSVVTTNLSAQVHGNDCIYPSPGTRYVKEARSRETALLQQRIAELEDMLQASNTGQTSSQLQASTVYLPEEPRSSSIDCYAQPEPSTQVGMQDKNSHMTSMCIVISSRAVLKSH